MEVDPNVWGNHSSITLAGEYFKSLDFVGVKHCGDQSIVKLRSCTYPMTRQGINSLANSESPLKKRTKYLLYKDFSPLKWTLDISPEFKLRVGLATYREWCKMSAKPKV